MRRILVFVLLFGLTTIVGFAQVLPPPSTNLVVSAGSSASDEKPKTSQVSQKGKKKGKKTKQARKNHKNKKAGKKKGQRGKARETKKDVQSSVRQPDLTGLEEELA